MYAKRLFYIFLVNNVILFEDNINEIELLLKKIEKELREQCYIDMYQKLNKCIDRNDQLYI